MLNIWLAKRFKIWYMSTKEPEGDFVKEKIGGLKKTLPWTCLVGEIWATVRNSWGARKADQTSSSRGRGGPVCSLCKAIRRGVTRGVAPKSWYLGRERGWPSTWVSTKDEATWGPLLPRPQLWSSSRHGSPTHLFGLAQDRESDQEWPKSPQTSTFEHVPIKTPWLPFPLAISL